MFVDGVALEDVLETSDGFFAISALVRISGDHLILSEFWMYPATSAREKVGVTPLLEVVRILKEEAREQGLLRFTLETERVYRDGRRRIIDLTGRVQ